MKAAEGARREVVERERDELRLWNEDAARHIERLLADKDELAAKVGDLEEGARRSDGHLRVLRALVSGTWADVTDTMIREALADGWVRTEEHGFVPGIEIPLDDLGIWLNRSGSVAEECGGSRTARCGRQHWQGLDVTRSSPEPSNVTFTATVPAAGDRCQSTVEVTTRGRDARAVAALHAAAVDSWHSLRQARGRA